EPRPFSRSVARLGRRRQALRSRHRGPHRTSGGPRAAERLQGRGGIRELCALVGLRSRPQRAGPTRAPAGRRRAPLGAALAQSATVTPGVLARVTGGDEGVSFSRAHTAGLVVHDVRVLGPCAMTGAAGPRWTVGLSR